MSKPSKGIWQTRGVDPTSMSDLPPLSLDTNVVSIVISSGNEYSNRYDLMLQGRTLAITYFARAELESAEWTREKRELLDDFLGKCIDLQNPTVATRRWFARAKQVRTRLNLDRGAEREDLWLLSQTAEHALPLICHDYNAIRVARGMGLDWTATLLNQTKLDAYFEEDERMLRKNPIPEA